MEWLAVVDKRPLGVRMEQQFALFDNPRAPADRKYLHFLASGLRALISDPNMIRRERKTRYGR